MLSRNRPRQPINGVIVAISIADVLNLSAKEVAAHADAIRKRLDELHEELKVDFPVYAIFTPRWISSRDSPSISPTWTKRSGKWFGAPRFRPQDKKANNVGKVPDEIDLLIQRISERMPERLQEEPDLRSRERAVRISGAARRDPQADRRLSQSRLRAHALPDDRNLARLLLHLRYAGGNAVRLASLARCKRAMASRASAASAFRGRARAFSWRTF